MRRLVLSFLRKVAPPIYRAFPVVRRIRYGLVETDFAWVVARLNPIAFVRRRMARHDFKLYRQLFAAAVSRGPEYVPYSETRAPLDQKIKLIAFYLPQFHPIPENDAWWGKGFTEWTNVSKAVPQFAGHYQPRLPDELGFYDLRVPEIQERQVEIARNYGIHGFCFHYYWFSGGKRLLERPLDQFMSNPNTDFPFCICWANENWTRRWDGRESEILMEQRHEARDDLHFIRDLAPVLKHKNYIRVDSKPIILIYRVELLRDPANSAQVWKEFCNKNGIGEIFIAAVQSFEKQDPREFGFDAIVEFPPHDANIFETNEYLNFFDINLHNTVFQYSDLARSFKERDWPEYQLFKTVVPSWDNEPRRPGRGTVFHNSSPELFESWLRAACEQTKERYENDASSFVFVNAWNEWAEGAYLEPDRRLGYAYLRAVREVLSKRPNSVWASTSRRIAVVSHDAHPHGAQHTALNLCRMLHDTFGFELQVILLGDGSLRRKFEAYGDVFTVGAVGSTKLSDEYIIRELSDKRINTIICNTAVTGNFIKKLKRKIDDIRIVTLIHELPQFLSERRLIAAAKNAALYSDIIVFANEFVKAKFLGLVGIKGNETKIIPQGIIKYWRGLADRAAVRERLRTRFGIAQQSKVVLGIGFADKRKGIDLFVDVASQVCGTEDDVVFMWVGHFDGVIEASIRGRVAALGLINNVVFTGRIDHEEVAEIYAGADLYLLTSREDPFPSTVLEALYVGLPVVGFQGVTGSTGLIEACGRLVPAFDIDAMASTVEGLLSDEKLSLELGRRGREIIGTSFSFRSYAFDIAALLHPDLERVSVIIPTYNHARFLEERIRSICDQSYPIYEVIVLDDASTDGTEEWLAYNLERYLPGARLIRNESNSGSVWRQWQKGVSAARGDYVWIAEDDDLCEPSFLQTMLSVSEASDAAVTFCDSFQIDATGQRVGDSYAPYCDAENVVPQFAADFVMNGRQFVEECLSVKNTILNVSSVLWRRQDLSAALEALGGDLARYGVAGDWRLYCEVALMGANIAYVASPLNGHRRHAESVTYMLNKSRHMDEIVEIQSFVSSQMPLRPEQSEKRKLYNKRISRQFFGGYRR